ncbi:MAG: YdhR family protein [Desulfuromonas sp.]|nr:YdhR family protein [Desulfuromonas sp.]
MITTIVQFALPQPMTVEQAKAVFLSTAEKYQQSAGLIRKYYLLSDDGLTAGGVYLWQSRAQAETMFSDEWFSFVKGKYGGRPTVSYFSSPVVVDNVTGYVEEG